MINKEYYMDKIDTYFAQLISYISIKNKKDLFDINKFCEDLFCEILNKIYGLKLENLNRTKGKNYPAVDLGDYSSSVSYQITSTHKSDKIKDTLDKVEKYELYKEFNDIYILILGEKGKYKSKKLTEPKYEFEFSIKKNIVDISDLSAYIFENKSIHEMKKICDYLDDNIGKYQINNKKNKKIKRKDKLELTDEQIKEVLEECELKLEIDVSNNDIKEVLKKIRQCNDLEKSILSNILEECNGDDGINLIDIFNEYENLDINEYIICIKNLREKKFIDDRRYYTYADPIQYVDDEVEETAIGISSGIWRLETQGEILMILKNIIGSKLLID